MREQAFLLRVVSWLKRQKVEVALALALMIIGGTVSAINMTGYPQRFEDEGTYVAQAWAIKEQGTLAHYTYWYDHPPVGWIQIAAWLMAFNGLERYGSAITAGREFMLVMHIVTIGLLYALARRLTIGRLAATGGVLLFALSPLSVEFGRYVLLDNVALPWLLAAFLLALSPKRSMAAAIGAAVCMAIAILSKETLLVLLPVILYMLWRGGDKRNRRYTLTAFGVIFAMLIGTYVLYAALKNELFPGAGHVSLIGTFLWQLFGREGSGSIFDSASSSYGLVAYWLGIDYVLLAAGLLSVLPALAIRSLRPIGLALLISLVMLLRSGYLPYPYVIVLLPFSALCFAGVIDKLLFEPIKKGVWFSVPIGSALVILAFLIAGVVTVNPAWQSKLATQMTEDADLSSRQTVDWIAGNVPHSNRMVIESALWVDLHDKGFDQPNPVWLYKTETDPAVSAQVQGGDKIGYVVLNGPTLYLPDFEAAFPTVAKAIQEGELVAEFGENKEKVFIYQTRTRP